ncbi:ABC-type nitrate/sulfonate/bicarbonate transport systems, periplasmic component [Clostridium pasteurianum DSM 525 = ATCC 6013]|uniref:ABC-type nitrate/sulfonate/bicarbonate transport systems, periplasmic component n=1 Tax=Clostridium pasteurianum DSM 525 = ATCC 6013 TaxID=1262449 RepID=A0A0H3J908_CLOPA|nr:ABC transporter substrate-binding protein [Clostridium pasteurianum]AJA47590.1 ABC-type nitrate/sulfonate/bicarbonate transport systems, periplasmic component [Clostridium pasteurianum DSM 525 = ATCC 6013]AJA51578.1 ABC-type nitrate/sulfonate/bicarbonate transport systems, periplasmic component [Clostridium pasteurianum DSM 525 = ATCC 6013]AOZ74904.1 nitrate ABC transporter substrate-binding protein [Clostridium pasteurianum DSM 525 = ATCC 6013]AOZ78699.1 nitrate ABC transporter substrate-bi
MKKKLFYSFAMLLSVILIVSVFTGCGSSTDSKTSIKKVKLNEVTRSVFYAPMYAAINQGYFKEEGLELDISTGQGADKTMQQVISKNADIGFCGPEQSIYIQNQNKEDYPVVFAQLTQRDGSFLVGRNEEKDFKWESLKGKTIIGGRPGGVPEMALEYVLKNHGIDPKKDVKIITNIDFTATSGAFKAGTGDYVALFEPTASILKKSNSGYIEASIGAAAGAIPYTCYFATKSYIDKNPDVIQKFTNAIYKGQKWVNSNSDAAVAEKIKSFFPGTDVKLIQENVKNYRAVNAYATDPVIKEDDINRLMDIIQGYNSSLIKKRPAFSKLVNTDFAAKAVKEVK